MDENAAPSTQNTLTDPPPSVSPQQQTQTVVEIQSAIVFSSKNPYMYIAIALGILWIIDGILQLQPKMFTREFIDSVILPTSENQPKIVTDIVHFGASSFSYSYFVSNLMASTIQVFSGVLLVFFHGYKKIFSFGLILSILWGVCVWIFGEGFGGIFTGRATFYTGAPGSVIFYIILALFLLFPKKFPQEDLAKFAGILLILNSLFNLSPFFWSKEGIQSLFELSSADPISFIAQPAQSLSSLALSTPLISNLVALLIPVLVGLGLLFTPGKVSAIAAAIFLFATWWLGQDFGGIVTFLSGTSTDPNSAPVLFIFLLPVLFSSRKQEEVSLQDHSLFHS